MVAKTLFGVATVEDTNIMKEQIKRIKRDRSRFKDKLAFIQNKQHSFMVKSIERETFLQKCLWMTKEMLQSSVNQNKQKLREVAA